MEAVDVRRVFERNDARSSGAKRWAAGTGAEIYAVGRCGCFVLVGDEAGFERDSVRRGWIAGKSDSAGFEWKTSDGISVSGSFGASDCIRFERNAVRRYLAGRKSL